MRNYKGFIFSIDATIALIVAAIAVSILLYMNFSAPKGLFSSTNEAESLLQNLLTIKLKDALANGFIPQKYLTPYIAQANGTLLAKFSGTGQVTANVLLVTTAANSINTVTFWMNSTSANGIVPFGFHNYDLFIGSNCLGFNTTSNGIYGFNSVGLSNKWQFIAAEFFNGAYTGNSLIYLNGTQKTLSQCTGTASTGTASTDVYISGWGNSAKYYFNGTITNLQIYNISLSAQQITQLYQQGIGGAPITTQNLVAWYPLNGNPGDYSGHKYTGTQTNLNYIKANFIPFKSYNISLNSSLLETMASLYTNNQGAYASLMLNYVENSSTVGILVNSTFAPAVSTSGFNGANSYVYAPVGSWLGTNHSLTAAAWFYSPSGGGPVFGVTSSPPGAGWNSPFISVDSNALIYGWINGSTKLTYQGKFNTWYFVAVSYNKTAKVVTLFVNGQQSSNTIGKYVTLGAFDYFTTYITGTKPANVPSYFNGNIANLQIYNTSLTAQQISLLYQRGIGGIPIYNSTLSGWWPLDGNANDYSGNNNDGIPNNMVYGASTYIPSALGASYEVSKATAPMAININGNVLLRNVSVITWR